MFLLLLLLQRLAVAQIPEYTRGKDYRWILNSTDARNGIMSRLSFLREEGGDLPRRIVAALERDMAEEHIVASVSGREKSPYSIWRKMQIKNVAFEQLSDIMAFRIVVATIPECYQVLGVIHGRYPTVPGRFKDYISTPKPNGYRSLHTAAIGPERQRIEIQIRTREMHEEAELGVAAHWAYKSNTRSDGKQYRWLRELLEIVDNAQKPEEFLEHTKLELFQDQVFCFTPKGDLIALPRGATPVDFAYAVHSEVGDHCVGAKVNGRIVPLNSKLSNGDQVDIIRSKNQTPSPAWERFVVTGKARARIRRYIRNQQRQEYATLGKAMLLKSFRQDGHEFSEKLLQAGLKALHAESMEDLYAEIGAGNRTTREVAVLLFPPDKTIATPDDLVETKVLPFPPKARAKAKERPLPIRGLIPGLAVHFARCCHPLPGDRIVGIVPTG